MHAEPQRAGIEKRKREESRRRKKIEEQSKTYESYDWVELHRGGLFKKLTVSIFEMYLDKHKIKCAKRLLMQDKLDVEDVGPTIIT